MGRNGQAQEIAVRTHTQVIGRHIVMRFYIPSVGCSELDIHPGKPPHEFRKIPVRIPAYGHRIPFKHIGRTGLYPECFAAFPRTRQTFSYGRFSSRTGT